MGQIPNGEFLGTTDPWQTSGGVEMEVISVDGYSGGSAIQLTSDGSGDKFYMRTNEHGLMEHAPGRTMLHLIQGSTYTISFMAGSGAGTGSVQVSLRDVADESTIKEFNAVKV